jgi:IMP dehydrogenase
MSPQAESIAAMEVSLSFDDVLLLPGRSSVLPTDCDVTTKLSRLALRIPMMSSAMDTVTEAQTAIAMALMGGIGVLHRNCSPEEQAKMVRRVKKFQHAVIASPITVRPVAVHRRSARADRRNRHHRLPCRRR